MTLQEFANQFVNYIQQNGGSPSNWYVGIASDIQQRLFGDHNVSQNGMFIYDNAQTEENARAVEKYLIESLKTKGDTGGGDNSTTWVYAYLITAQTRE